MSFQIYTAGGNLTDNPEMKYVKETPKTTFSIAINEKRGQNEETLFVDVECWDKLAEMVAEYKRKGDYVVVIGRWKMDQWESEDGQKRRKWYVRADQVKFEGKRSDSSDDREPRRRSRDEDDRPRRRDDRDRDDDERRREKERYNDLPF